MVLAATCLGILMLAVLDIRLALADVSHEVSKQLPGSAARRFTSIDDANTFLQSFVHHNFELEEGAKTQQNIRQDESFTRNASSTANSSMFRTTTEPTYSIDWYDDVNCEVPNTTHHDLLATTGIPGCYKIVLGSLIGSSFQLECVTGNTEQVMQQIYQGESCQGDVIRKRLMMWKFFTGSCQNKQKMKPALHPRDLPLCKRKMDAVQKGENVDLPSGKKFQRKNKCDCSWVKKKKACAASLHDGSRCFSVCCNIPYKNGKIQPFPDGIMPSSIASVKNSSKRAATIHNISLETDMEQKAPKKDAQAEDSSVHVIHTSPYEVIHTNPNQHSISNGTNPSNNQTHVGRCSCSYPHDPNQCRASRKESYCSKVCCQMEPPMPHIIDTCECSWAHNTNECSIAPMGSYCRKTCCRAQANMGKTKVAVHKMTEMPLATIKNKTKSARTTGKQLEQAIKILVKASQEAADQSEAREIETQIQKIKKLSKTLDREVPQGISKQNSSKKPNKHNNSKIDVTKKAKNHVEKNNVSLSSNRRRKVKLPQSNAQSSRSAKGKHHHKEKKKVSANLNMTRNNNTQREDTQAQEKLMGQRSTIINNYRLETEKKAAEEWKNQHHNTKKGKKIKKEAEVQMGTYTNDD